MRSIRPPILALLACLLMLGGCSQKQIDLAKEAVADAKTVLAAADAAKAAAEQAEAIARDALDRAEALAQQIGAEKAQDLIDDARRAVDEAHAASAKVAAGVEAARVGVQRSENAVVAAEKEQAGGGGTIAVIGAAILAGLGGWSGAAALAQRAIAKYTTALTLTAEHADAMETAETEADVKAVKKTSVQAQIAAGVFDLIAAARGKA